jgi:hypothetical protein
VARSGITTADGFERLYRRIGEPCDNQHLQECRETTAAIEVENRVLAELAPSGRARPAAGYQTPSRILLAI